LVGDVTRDGINMIVFGPQKQGKSWLGDTTPAPRLILDAEGGSRFTPSRKIPWDPITQEPPQADGTWDTAIVYVRDYRTVDRAFEWLNSGKHPFRSVTLDSVSEIQQRAIDDIAGVNQMDQQAWGRLLRTISELIRRFRDLSTHPTNPLDAVVFIAMAVNLDDKWRPFMQGQIKTTMPYYVDLCTYLAKMPLADGTMVRRLFIEPQPGFEIGERVGGCLGPYIDDANVTDMLETVRAFIAKH
jgi:hypothetical protein